MRFSKILLGVFAVGIGFELIVVPARAKEPRLLIVAVDGADWDLIEECVIRKECPNFRSLANQSARVQLQTVWGEGSSPTIWTTIATGKTVQKHGVPGVEFSPQPSDRRVKAMWNIFSEAGWKVGMFGYLVTSATESIHGVMVSAPWLSPRLEVGPAGIIDLSEITKGLGSGDRERLKNKLCGKACEEYLKNHEAGSQGPTSLRARVDLLTDIYIKDESMVRSAETVLKKRDTDLAVVYLQGADITGHSFMHYFDPAWQDISLDGRIAFGNIILHYYQEIDGWLGRLLSFAGPDTMVLVLSDHGAIERNITTAAFMGGHRGNGVFLLKSKLIMPGAYDLIIRSPDVLPTMLYLGSMPVAQDMDGRVYHSFVRPEFLEDHPIRFIQSYEPFVHKYPIFSERNRKSLTPRDAQLLRALGYLQ